MREFLKLIVSILVIAVIAYTLYFFLHSNAEYRENNSSGEVYTTGEENNNDLEINDNEGIIEDNSISNNEELENEEQNVAENNQNSNRIDISQVSGEISGEIIGDLSGNIITSEDLEEKIAKINLIETKNNLANLTKSIEDNVGIDIIGIKNQDYFDNFSMNEMAVTVQLAGSMIYIISMPDFVDNAQYHYDENGNLALYICELTGVGGEIRYYFENDSLLTQVENVEEDIQLNYESIEEIIERSKLIYNQYKK